MNEITRRYMKIVAEENPGCSVHVYCEFMTPRQLKRGEPMTAVCGHVPTDWNGDTVWMSWPGIYCEI